MIVPLDGAQVDLIASTNNCGGKCYVVQNTPENTGDVVLTIGCADNQTILCPGASASFCVSGCDQVILAEGPGSINVTKTNSKVDISTFCVTNVTLDPSTEIQVTLPTDCSEAAATKICNLAELQATMEAALGNVVVDVNITNDPLEVTPGAGWEAVIQAGVEAALLAKLEAILISALETANITVNAVQSGTWNVTVDGEVELGQDTIDAITQSLAGTVFDINVTNGTLTVTLDQDSLDALEEITVTIDTSAGPVDVNVTGTVTVTGAVSITNLDDLATILEGLEVEVTNFQDLADLLDGLTVNIGTMPPFVINSTQFDAIINAIQNSDLDDTDDDIRPTATATNAGCVCDADGVAIGTAIFEKIATYNELGVETGTANTLNVIPYDGTGVRPLAAGEAICKPELDLSRYETECATEGSSNLWLLLSKCELNGTNQCDTAGNFPGVVQVGDIPSGSGAVHPAGANAGDSINGWNAFAICSPTQPADDGNQHYWIPGSVDDYTIAGFVRTGPDPVCSEEENPALLVKHCGPVEVTGEVSITDPVQIDLSEYESDCEEGATYSAGWGMWIGVDASFIHTVIIDGVRYEVEVPNGTDSATQATAIQSAFNTAHPSLNVTVTPTNVPLGSQATFTADAPCGSVVEFAIVGTEGSVIEQTTTATAGTCLSKKVIGTTICKADLDYLIKGIVSGITASIIGDDTCPCDEYTSSCVETIVNIPNTVSPQTGYSMFSSGTATGGVKINIATTVANQIQAEINAGNQLVIETDAGHRVVLGGPGAASFLISPSADPLYVTISAQVDYTATGVCPEVATLYGTAVDGNGSWSSLIINSYQYV